MNTSLDRELIYLSNASPLAAEDERWNTDALAESVSHAERRVRELLDVAVARLQLVGAARPFPKLKPR